MTYQADMSEGIDAIYALGGVPAVFTDRDSAATNVTAIIEHDLSQYGEEAQVAGATAVISVRVSDLQYPPRNGETYTIDGTVYRVDSPLRSDELEHAVLVS